MSERRATVVLQWAEQRIDVELITWPIQIAATIIAAEVVTARNHYAAVIVNISSHLAGIQHGISDGYRYRITNGDTAAEIRRVTAESRIADR